MSSYRLSPAAQGDLSEIWDSTESRWDVDQAERYIREIQAAIERVADDPERGRRRDDVRAAYPQYGAGSHLIFFREAEGGIDVIRILHRRMDPTRHI